MRHRFSVDRASTIEVKGLRIFNAVGSVWILCGALAFTGCKKQESPPPAAPQKTSSAISDLVDKKAESAPAATEAAAPVPSQAQPAEAEGQKSSNGMPDSQALYAGIQRYMAEHQGRAAKGIEELVAGRYIPPLPAPPAGKKYQLDQRFATLTVVDK